MLKPQNLESLLSGDCADELLNKLRIFLRSKDLDNNNTYCFPPNFKDRFECLVSTLKQFIDNSNCGKKLSIDENLNYEIGQLLASLVYLTNSTSFSKGEYYQFDKDEINRKLRRGITPRRRRK